MSKFQTASQLLGVSFYDAAMIVQNANALIAKPFAPFTAAATIADVLSQFQAFAAEAAADEPFDAADIEYDVDFVVNALGK